MVRAFTSAAKRAIPAAACLLAASLVVVVRAGEKAQLTGRWNFNAKVSDDAEQIVRDAQQSSHQPSETRSYPGAPGRSPGSYPGVGVDTPIGSDGGVRTGDPDGIGRSPVGGAAGGVNYPGGNGGETGSGGGRGGGNESGNRGNPAWDWLTRNPKFLQIDQHTKQMMITDDSGHVRTYYLDGKKHEEKDANGDKISTKAQWEGNTLVAETRTANSGVLTETLRASQDGNQIYVKTRFESPSLGGPVSIRRVYDLAPAPAK